MTIFVITVVFLVMLLMPFFVAGNVMNFSSKPTLQIKFNNRRDPRYFAKSFRAMMDSALASSTESGVIMLSKAEHYCTGIPDVNEVDSVVFCREPTACKEPKLFLKELYCCKNLSLAPDTVLRAVAGLEDVTLGARTDLARWADAEHVLHCGEDCILGISASSGRILELEKGCCFKRLFAPEIRIGTVNAPMACSIEEKHSDAGNIWRTKIVEDDETVETDVISNGSLGIGRNALVTGSVKAFGNVRVKKGARIIGNLISDGTIALEEGVFVGGVVFSEDSILIGSNCQIGKKYTTKSVVAKNSVTLCSGSRVYGYVSCERGGKTVSPEEYTELIAQIF